MYYCFPPGRLGNFHDLHQWPAHRVCGHRADLPRPQESRRQGRGRGPDEIKSYRRLCPDVQLLPIYEVLYILC